MGFFGRRDTYTSSARARFPTLGGVICSRMRLLSIERVEVAVHGGFAELPVVVAGITLALVTFHHLGHGAADVLGLAFEAVVALAAAAENAALFLELGHSHGWELRGLVVLSGVVVNLVDRDSGVDHAGLDGFLVDYRLDGLVDVLVVCKAMLFREE